MKTLKKIYALMLMLAVLLSSCFVAASALTPERVTIDFENDSMGSITVENGHLNTGDDSLGESRISAEYNDANFNINQTKKLYPGNNNSFHFAGYFTGKAVDSFTFDSYGLNNFTASVRVVEFDATHKVQLGKSDENTFSFAPYGGTDVKTIHIPLTEYIHWFTVRFDYVGKTVFASIRPYNSEVWSTPAELCTLAAAPTDLAISHGFANNVASDLFCMPIDNIIIDYKSDQTVEFESKYGHLFSLTNAKLDDSFTNDYAAFQTAVRDLNAAIACMDADADLKAENADILAKLTALKAYAASLDSNEVTIDFEDGTMGKITGDTTDAQIKNYYNDTQFNINQTMKLYAGNNNSFQFADYFGGKTVTSFTFDMYCINNNTIEPYRYVELDAAHKVRPGKSDADTFTFLAYDGTEVNTMHIPGQTGVNWFSVKFDYVGNTVYASVKGYNSDVWSTPAELCTLDAAPANLTIHHTWVDNGEYDANYSYLPIDNVVIQYKSAEMEAFENKYNYLLSITEEQLEAYYNSDTTQFHAIVTDAKAAIAEINAGDADFKAAFAGYLTKLTALVSFAGDLEASTVTIDFEDGTKGKITMSENTLNSGTGFTDPIIQTGYNTGATKQFFPGCNNSMHLANYFSKPVASVSIDMYFNGAINMFEASSLIRKMELGDDYSINFGMESNGLKFRLFKGAEWYQETQLTFMEGCVPGEWYTVVVSYVNNDVYISAKALGGDTLSAPVKICTLRSAPSDFVISTGWVEQSASYMSLPIDNIVIQYVDTNPYSLAIEQGAYIRTISKNGYGNGISFKTVVTANPNFDAGTLAEIYYGTLAMDTENLGDIDSVLTYEMTTVANSKGHLAKKAEKRVALSELSSITDWRTSIVSSEEKGTTVLDFGNKNQTIRSYIRYRLTSDPAGQYRFIYSSGNSVSRSFYQTAINAYNANIDNIMDVTGLVDLQPIEGVTENNAITACYYLGQYGYELDAAIVSHEVYQALAAQSQS